VGEEYLFISDCHLDSGRPEIAQALIEFLQTRASGASRLYILGDLFEVWLGDDDPAQEQSQVIDSLRQLTSSCDVYFMAGNRDFLLGEAFANRVGMTLLDEPLLLQLGQLRVALLHGDSLCTDDYSYQAFRSMVRERRWIDDFLAKPLLERQQIAMQLRSDSIAAMSEKSSEIMDVNADAVAQCFRENRADVIIHGHTHRPATHYYESDLTRIVLGDWVDEPSFLSWKPESGFNLTDPRIKLAG
jgi:UDP-2,3-diacylglucosamine hydrolase